MGTIIQNIEETKTENRYCQRAEKLQCISEMIRSTNPNHPAAEDYIWIWDNFSKITRNRKLIELIG